MLTKLIFISLASVSAFFNPTVKLSSGRTATLTGRGPPVLFSTGLFGTMPSQFYSELIQKLKKNVTVVTFNGLMPVTPKDVFDLADTLKVDALTYVGHSSFNPEILESTRINNAVLVDPIVIPSLDVTGVLNGGLNAIDAKSVDVDFHVVVVKTEKLYESKLDLPTWQELEINGDVYNEVYEGVGHPDLLDDTWANMAKSTDLWGTAQGETMPFKEWKYDNKNTVPHTRKEFRNYVSKIVLGVVNDVNDVNDVTEVLPPEIPYEPEKKPINETPLN